jgi:hypothetical protein
MLIINWRFDKNQTLDDVGCHDGLKVMPSVFSLDLLLLLKEMNAEQHLMSMFLVKLLAIYRHCGT